MIFSILEEVAATPSRNEKESILLKHVTNDVLRLVFQLAYDKQVLFQTTTPPDESLWATKSPYMALVHALEQVQQNICNRKYTGHAAVKFYEDIFAQLDQYDASVLARVITKDLRIGATRSTAEKVWPGILPKPAFMLAQNDSSRIKWPAYSQVKEDGSRCKLTFDGRTVTGLTRAGNEILLHGVFDEDLQSVGSDLILDGELVAFRNGKRLSRQESNGIVNKAIKGTISEDEAKLIKFVAWDIENSNEIYSARFEQLTKLTAQFKNILLVESKTVNTYEEAHAHFKEMRRRGLEGTLLKNIDAKWVGSRVFDLCKFKAEIEAEFEVIGYEEGTGKNKGKLGALIVADRNRTIVSKVGIFKNFPETVRNELYGDHVLGTIVTVLYNERTQDKKSSTESLFLPRVTKVRLDKSEADDRATILAIESAVLAD